MPKSKENDNRLTIELMPNELLNSIFDKLCLSDLLVARLVCKRWASLVPRTRNHRKFAVTITMANRYKSWLAILGNCMYVHSLRIESELDNKEFRTFMEKYGKRLEFLHLESFALLEHIPCNLEKLREFRLGELVGSVCNPKAYYFKFYRFPNLKTLVINDFMEDPTSENFLFNLLRYCEAKVVRLQSFSFLLLDTRQRLFLLILLENATTLKELKIQVWVMRYYITRAWQAVFRQLVHLEKLVIVGSLSADFYKIIVDCLPSRAPLRHFECQGNLFYDASALGTLFKKWPNIRHVDFTGTSELDDRIVQHMNVNGTLRTLNLSNCGKFTCNALITAIALKVNTNLVELELDDCKQLDEETLCMLSMRMPNLRRLNLKGCGKAVTDRALGKICLNMMQLKQLNLDNCFLITDSGMRGWGLRVGSFKRLRKLESLSLCGCDDLTNRSFTKAMVLPELRKLRICNLNYLTSKGIKGLVRNCPLIEELSISSCALIDDKAIEYLAKCLPRLRFLNLNNCPKMTKQAFEHIDNNCKMLQLLFTDKKFGGPRRNTYFPELVRRLNF